MFDITKTKKHIQNLMKQLDFPPDAQKTFMDALTRISNNKAAGDRFSCLLQQYDESENCSYKQMLADIKEIGTALEIHQYTASMLMYLCMAETLHSRYLARGIDEEIYYNSMADLRYKLEECRLVYGINGTFVADWLQGYFDLTRFALGRLQFEIITTTEEYTIDGITLPAGSKAINTHIPRTGTRLDHEEVLKSYRLAAEMFACQFKSQPIVFICSSWLLDPWNITVLSPTSNLAAFYSDFKIVKSCEYSNYDEIWRLFDCLYTGNASDLPKDSSLRKAYAKRIERGEPIAWGVGLFIYPLPL